MAKTFGCPDGKLVLGFNPDSTTSVQSSKWHVLEGTGRHDGMQGQGWMVVRFDPAKPDEGNETFTGVVAGK
jgi:hypothetical protein